MKKTDKTSRQKRLNRLITVEIILCYMAVLTVVSYWRGPEKYGAAEEPLLVTESFQSLAGQPAEPGGTFPFENQTPGEAVGYLAELDLRSLWEVLISFQVDCPEEYAGGILVVDLCNGEAGYDDPEQEFQLTLQPGLNQADFGLDPGLWHPDTAQLRFFTLDRAGYRLENVQIHEQILLPKIPVGTLYGAGLCFLLLAVTAGWEIMPLRKK